MMKSMVEFIKKEQNITYGTFDVEATTPSEYPEALGDHIGNSYGGESVFFIAHVLYRFVLKLEISHDRERSWSLWKII